MTERDSHSGRVARGLANLDNEPSKQLFCNWLQNLVANVAKGEQIQKPFYRFVVILVKIKTNAHNLTLDRISRSMFREGKALQRAGSRQTDRHANCTPGRQIAA